MTFFGGDDEPRNDDPEHETRPGFLRRAFRWFVAGFAVLVVSGLAVWVLTGPPEGPPPVITGPELPDRRAPDDQSNLVPNRDQPIFDRVIPGNETGPAKELLAEPERPLDLAAVAEQAKSQDAESGIQAAPPPIAPPTVPETAREAQTASADPAAEDPTAPAAPPTQPAEEKPADIKPAPAANVPAPAPDDYRIQIASVRSEESAASEWKRVSSRHPDLLGRLKPFYEVFRTSNNSIYYRVQAGPLVDKALADLLCAQLKARKVACLVIAP